MTNEKKQEYTLKITSANKSELIVIIYDIALDYITESKKAMSDSDKSKFYKAIDCAQKSVESLITGLNFDYEISKNLWHLYFYINKKLAEAIKNYSLLEVDEAENILKTLRASFAEIAKQDDSNPMMGNTQSVIAGMTYGKNSLNENLQNNGNNRGYFA